MRVTQAMVANDIVANLSATYQTIATMSNELSSGRQIMQPSDSPAGTSYAIDLQASLDMNTEYQTTSQAAVGWMQSNGTALDQLQQVLSRVRQLTVQGSNDTNTPTDRQAISAEVSQLVQQVQMIGNTQFGNSYIFAGTLTQSPPFSATGGYSGNTSAISMQIATNFAMRVNADPTTFLSGKGGVFDMLQQVTRHLTSTGNPVSQLNAGTETVALGGAYSGTPAPPQNILTKVTSVSAGAVTGVSFSLNGGATWNAGTMSGNTATLNSVLPSITTGLTATFTPGAVSPAVGDGFSFTATSAGVANFPVSATPNVGNAAPTVTGTYTGAGSPNLEFKAATSDSNNNVIGVQVSTDGGATWGATITASNYSGSPLATGTAGTFDVGNGLTLTWNQSTVNAATVATNGDTFTYQPVGSLLSGDLSSLDTIMNTVSGLQAQFGAQQNSVQQNITSLQSQSLQWQGVMTHTVDADYAALATQMASAQTLYQAALAVDAKSIEPALVQFLK